MSDLLGTISAGNFVQSTNFTSPFTYGIRFQVTSAGYINRIGFYRAGTGTTYWTELLLYGAGGTLLWSSSTLTDSGTVGWQWTTLLTNVAVNPGVTYTVAASISSGRRASYVLPVNVVAAPAPFLRDDTLTFTANATHTYPTTVDNSSLVGLSATWSEFADSGPSEGEGDPSLTGDLASWLSSNATAQTHETDGLPWLTKVVADATKNAVDASKIVIDATKAVVDAIPKASDPLWVKAGKLWEIAGVLTEAEIDLWNLFAKRAPGQLTGPTPGGGSAFFGPSGGQVAERAEVAATNGELLWHRTQTTNWLDAVPGGDWLLVDTLEWDGPVAWEQEADCYVFHITATPTYASEENVAGSAYWPKAAWWAPMTGTLVHERRFAEFEFAVLHALPMRCPGILLRPRANFAGTLEAWMRPTPPVS